MGETPGGGGDGSGAKVPSGGRHLAPGQDAIEQLLLHTYVDEQTGAYSERVFIGAIEEAIRQRGGRGIAVCAAEMEGYDRIEDALGRAAARRVLRDVVARISTALRRNDLMARLGTASFGLLLVQVDDRWALEKPVERILASLRQPFQIDGISVRVSMRLGCALGPEHGEGASALLQCAGMALRAIRHQPGPAYSVFHMDMWQRSLRNLALLGDLPRAIEQGELVMHYQPQVDLRTGELIGAEALVRWQHPHDGLLPPAEFVAVAEDGGLIGALGEWVANEVFRQAAVWRADGLRDCRIDINVSPRQVQTGGLADMLARRAAESGHPPYLLGIELTENTFLDDPENAIAELMRLRERGFHVAIDDFGTGYSAFALLVRLPVTCLKIDRSFVLGLPGDLRHSRVVRTTIALAHSLDMTVVAEGVETAEQARLLASHRCDAAQGFHFARPAPGEAFAARWLVPGAPPFGAPEE